MRTITFKLLTNTTTTTESVYGQAFANDDNATELVFDFTGTDVVTWDKWLDLSMSDMTKDTQSLGTDAIVRFRLAPEHTKRGDLRINPYAKSGTSRTGFPIQVLKVERQLNNSVVDASAAQSMIDYFDVALAVKAVTVETLAEGSQATASVTKEADGLTFAYCIPKGDTGAKGDAFVYEDFTTEQLDAIKAPLTEVAQAVTTAESSRVSAENTRVLNENARLVFQTYNGATAYVPGNKVAYNGSSYVCILASTGNLPTNTTYWLLIAQKGTDGINGEVTNASLATALGNYALKTQEAWITPTLINSNTAALAVGYMKDTLGFVHLKGRINSTGSTVIFALPVGYRPLVNSSFFGCRSGYGTIAVLEIGATGNCTLITAANGNSYDITGITFKAEQ